MPNANCGEILVFELLNFLPVDRLLVFATCELNVPLHYSSPSELWCKEAEKNLELTPVLRFHSLQLQGFPLLFYLLFAYTTKNFNYLCYLWLVNYPGAFTVILHRSFSQEFNHYLD